MMCESANDVTETSDRVPVGVPRKVDPRASHESSMTFRSCASAILRIASQSGTLPIRFGARIAFVRGPIIGSIASTSMLYVSGSTSTNTGTRPAAHDRRDVGRKRYGRGDDLVTGRQAQQLDREIQRGRAGVAHDPPALAEQLGDSVLEGAHVPPDPQGLRPTPKDGNDRVDLTIVVDTAGVIDASSAHRSPVQRK